MTTLTWPAGMPRPSGLTFSLRPNSQSFQSPLTKSTQTLEIPGARWVAVLSWAELVEAEIRLLRAFLAQLRGRAGRVALWDMSLEEPAGVATGTPVIRNRSNWLTYSQDLANAVWTQTTDAYLNVTANATTAPDGTATADKLIEATTDTGNRYIRQNINGAPDNTACTFSVYLKAAERGWAAVSFIDKAGGTVGRYVNLTTGALGGITGGTPSATVVTDAGSGWWRVSITSNTGTGGTPFIRIWVCDGDGAYSFPGVVNNGIYAWGAQVEAHATPGPYLATTSAAITDEAQAGATLYTSGWNASTAGILKAGDYIGVGGELKILTADAASDGAGNATLTIEPPLRASPANGAALTTSQPTAVFRLLDDDQDTIPIRPPLRGDVTLTFEEVFS